MNGILLESVAPSNAGASSLPLRRDEVLGVDVLAKVIFLTVLLLAAAYFLLRFYARNTGAGKKAEKSLLQYETGMRLSARTRAYVLRVDNVRVLVTESPAGISTLAIGKVDDAGSDRVVAENAEPGVEK